MTNIIVLEPGEGAAARHAHSCALGSDLIFDYRRLSAYCWRHLEGVDVDLLVLAGAVAFADRKIQRARGTQWARGFNLTVPVHEPEIWASARRGFEEVLEYLTGDTWRLSFTKRRQPDVQALALRLENPLSPSSVIPYSGGLDSFAEARRFARDKPGERALLMTTEHGGIRTSVLSQSEDGSARSRVGLPIRLGRLDHPEPTYRSRTFLFYSIAALAARLSGAEEILIGESGPGLLGPALVPFADEHPYRGSHPAFTDRLRRALACLWGGSACFAHPNLWRTKAELLRSLNETGHLDGWSKTRSCSRNVRRTRASRFDQCGICSGCLYRRISIMAAGLDESSDRAYLWQDLRGKRLRAVAGSDGLRRPPTQADLQVAVYAVLSLKSLGRVERNSSAFEQCVFELETVSQRNGVVSEQLERLLSAHADECRAFFGQFPTDSWMGQLASEDDDV